MPRYPTKQFIARTTKILNDPKTRFVPLKQAISQIEKERKQRAWAVQTSNGVILACSVRYRKKDAIAEFCKSWGREWSALRERGYRAVKVTVTRGWDHA